MKKNVLLTLCALVVSLLLAETGLRLAGYVPGRIHDIGTIHYVDSLKLFKGYAADSAARPYIDSASAQMVNALTAQLLTRQLNATDAGNKLNDIHSTDLVREVAEIPGQYNAVLTEPKKHALGKLYHSILQKDTLNDFDSVVINYVHRPVNNDGYKSPSFRKHSSKKRVLMLGDSFTYGFSCLNRIDCFSDLLLARGLEVYNTGLSAADVPQYMAIARKYIPEIKPDVVVANIYLGNDITYYEEKLLPYQPHIYASNSCYLPPCPGGVSMPSADSSYRFLLNLSTIPQTGNWFNTISHYSAVATVLWAATARFMPDRWKKTKETIAFEAEAASKVKPYPVINASMKELRALCNANNCRLIITAIPFYYINGNNKIMNHVADYKNLFPDEVYFEPKGLQPEDYSQKGDGHFIESGHLKYADFLQQLIVQEK